MTPREKIVALVAVTLCAILLIGTVGIAVHGPKVRFEVTIALIGQWGVLLAILREWMKGTSL